MLFDPRHLIGRLLIDRVQVITEEAAGDRGTVTARSHDLTRVYIYEVVQELDFITSRAPTRVDFRYKDHVFLECRSSDLDTTWESLYVKYRAMIVKDWVL